MHEESGVTEKKGKGLDETTQREAKNMVPENNLERSNIEF